MTRRCALPRLYVILDRGPQQEIDVVRVARQACNAGARMVLWRDRAMNRGAFYEVARQLAELTVPYDGMHFLVHDHVDVAIAVAAQGVHLPGDGLPTLAAREVIGRDEVVARSLHGEGEVKVERALSFATLSPIFESASKPGYGPALGTARLAKITSEHDHLPIYALGGVTPERVAECLDAGAHGVAVMGGISHAEDPYEATRAYLEAIEAWEASR